MTGIAIVILVVLAALVVVALGISAFLGGAR